MMNLKTPSGMVVELQLNTKAMLHAKEWGAGHHHYETMRSIDRRLGKMKGKVRTPEDQRAYEHAVAETRKAYAFAQEQSQATYNAAAAKSA